MLLYTSIHTYSTFYFTTFIWQVPLRFTLRFYINRHKEHINYDALIKIKAVFPIFWPTHYKNLYKKKSVFCWGPLTFSSCLWVVRTRFLRGFKAKRGNCEVLRCITFSFLYAINHLMTPQIYLLTLWWSVTLRLETTGIARHLGKHRLVKSKSLRGSRKNRH